MRAIGMGKVLTFYVTMAVVAVTAMWARGGADAFLPPANLATWALHVGMGLGVGLGMVALSRLAVAYLGWAQRLASEFRGLIGRVSGAEAFAIACLSSIGEEALFRGVLQPTLGLWLCTIIFALLHIGPNPRFIPWTIMAFAGGLLFGALFAWTSNLAAPVVAHLTVNFLNIRFLSTPDRHVELHLQPVGGERAVGL